MKRELNLKKDELEVVDGKVMISSDELAAAVQNSEIDLSAEDEADGFSITINFHC